MSRTWQQRGAAAVGRMTDLDTSEAAAVLYLRLWMGEAGGREIIASEFLALLGKDGEGAFGSFAALMDLFAAYGRRPLACHGVVCTCLGADESCFASLLSSAADGPREDAMLIATLLVRADAAPIVAGLAAEVALSLRRMALRAPRPVAPAGAILH